MSSATQSLAQKINAAVATAVAAPEVPAQPAAAPPIANAVTTAILPDLLNATNGEPWYQSRVTWGVIIAAGATIVKPFFPDLGITGEQATDLAAALATLGQVAGFALTLYGRWKAKRPIGQ